MVVYIPSSLCDQIKIAFDLSKSEKRPSICLIAGSIQLETEPTARKAEFKIANCMLALLKEAHLKALVRSLPNIGFMFKSCLDSKIL